jgi:hypothetical protein
VALSLFMAIAGGRLLLLRDFGTDLPQFDAWGIEGDGIFKPYFNGTLKLADFFSPCNEHRVVFTRLLSLGLLLVNGLWDNRLQTVVNALLSAGTGAFLAWYLARRLTAPAMAFGWLLLLAVFAAPFGWENALWGFQSQFYFLVAFSLAALCAAHGRQQLTVTSLAWTGLLQLATLFTMASGMLASLAILATSCLVLLRFWPDRDRRKLLCLQIGVAVVVIIIWKAGVYFPVPGHNHLRTPNLAAFFQVLAHCLSWPHVESGWWWTLAWLPWGILTASYLLRRGEDRGEDRFVIAIGFWVLLQAAATTYSRNPLAFSSKYADPLSLGMAANGLAILLLWARFGRAARLALLLFACGWTVWSGQALYGQSTGALHWVLPEKQAIYTIQRERTQAYLATGNFSYLIPAGKHEIPDRSPEGYAKRLTDPIIGPLLPRSVNQRYQLTGQPPATLSRCADLLLAAALPLLVAGTALAACSLLLASYSQLRSRKDAYAKKSHC